LSEIEFIWMSETFIARSLIPESEVLGVLAHRSIR